jgi:pyruvate,water dikinase
MNLLWLDDPHCRDPQLVGGKAAQLSLLAADFDVPPGFCVPAQLFDGLDVATDALPVALQDVIAAAYHALATRSGVADPPVAVRSSAIDEDAALASFAGLHTTLLHIVGVAELLDAVARCWRSAGSARAAAYRRQHGLDAVPRMAVLVQQLVAADASAVAFSVDPVSGDHDLIVVNATWGLGESLVGGFVTPDSYTLRKSDTQIVVRQVAEKTQMSVPAAGGTRQVAVPDERRHVPALDDQQVAEVARLARALEERMGWPVDIECAYACSRLALLQCRPVTTIDPGWPMMAWRHESRSPNTEPRVAATDQDQPPVEWATPDDAALTWRWGRQAFPGPLTPLMQSYLPFHTQGWVRDSRAEGMVGEIRIRFEHGYYYSLWQPTGLTTWEEADQRALEAERATPARWRDEFLPLLRADHQRVRALDCAALDDGELAQALQEALTAQIRHFTIHAHMASFPYGATERLLNWYIERFAGAPETEAYRLVQGLWNTSVESAHRLWDLSRRCTDVVAAALRARDWAGLSLDFAQHWHAYLEEFGHRTHALADPASPTWQEDPTPVAQLVLSYAAHSVPDPREEQAQLAAEREAFTAEVRERLDPEEYAVFERLLAIALANYPLTEDHNFWIDQQCPADLRLLCAEIGRRMAQRSTLESADDIAFLTLSELVLWGFGLADPLRPRVAQRKAEYEAQRRLIPPDFLGTPPTPQPWVDRFGGPPLPLDAEPGTIQGVGASAGLAVGSARVARTFDEAQALERGEVLVCPATDANWAPLFGVASALVTDTGGSLCHAAVLAREYHLPAVVGTHIATIQLQTGQRVEVDGLSGRVRLLE